MRIIITDHGLIWNHKNPLLKQFKDIVLVVCLDGKKATDDYECFVTDYEAGQWLGMDPYGAEGRRYQALEKAGEELNEMLGYHDRIVFLADPEPETLYPYLVIRKRNRYNSLHLCAMPPWEFEGKRRNEGYKQLIADLSELKSLLYIDSCSLAKELQNSGVKSANLMEAAEEKYSQLLPQILYGIQEMGGDEHYFDFSSMSYVPVKEGYDSIDLSLKSQRVDISQVNNQRGGGTLGFILVPEYPEDREVLKEQLEAIPPRIEGKKLCEFLRLKRIELASANNIDFESVECPSDGPCGGTCRKCDQEAKFLRQEMEKIPEEQRIYPHFEVKEMEF